MNHSHRPDEALTGLILHDPHTSDPDLHRAPMPATPYTPAPGPVPDRRIVGYERWGTGLIPVYEQQTPVQPTEPRDLTPSPVIDPAAQRLVGAGALAAGAGWGAGQLLGALAGLGTSTLLLVLLACLALRSLRPRPHLTQHITTTGFMARANVSVDRRR